MQNISAPFICAVPPFKATLDKAIGMADFVFGNETEAAAFAESEGWETKDVSEIALKISQTKADKKNPTVVRTSAFCQLCSAVQFQTCFCRGLSLHAVCTPVCTATWVHTLVYMCSTGAFVYSKICS